MKKNMVFILLFFLVFSIQIVIASGSTTRCRHYIDGVCQPGSGYVNIEEVSIEEETPIFVTPSSAYLEPPKYLILILQFIGIIVLVALLVIIINELFRPKGKKSKKGR